MKPAPATSVSMGNASVQICAPLLLPPYPLPVPFPVSRVRIVTTMMHVRATFASMANVTLLIFVRFPLEHRNHRAVLVRMMRAVRMEIVVRKMSVLMGYVTKQISAPLVQAVGARLPLVPAHLMQTAEVGTPARRTSASMVFATKQISAPHHHSRAGVTESPVVEPQEERVDSVPSVDLAEREGRVAFVVTAL